jgi:hypothetical protein
MQNITLLQFSTLADLATYIKTVHPATYIINTLKLTVLANFSEFEIALAIEQYNGKVVLQKAEAELAEKGL